MIANEDGFFGGCGDGDENVLELVTVVVQLWAKH